MARFRAFESDSGSSDEEEHNVEELPKPKAPLPITDGDEDQEEDEGVEGDELVEESDASDNLSEMEEDDIAHDAVSQSRPRKALQLDENGDFQVTGEVDAEAIEGDSLSQSSRSSSPDDPQALGPPSNIIPWARHVGVDAQKMHVMQTSLFRLPEEAAALKALNQPAPKQKTVAALTLSRKHSRDSEGEGLRHDSRERASFAHDIEPAILRPSRKYARVEITSSVALDKENAYVDAGLAFGRSFRVGWGPGGTLVYPGHICGPFASLPPSSITSSVTLTKTPFPPAKPRTADAEETEDTSPAALAEKLLQHHLTNTPITKSDNGAPSISPPPLNFASFASLFLTTHTTGPAPLFRLGSALFDPIDLRLGGRKHSSVTGAMLITPEHRNRVSLLRRRHDLSLWLEHVVKPTVEGDIRVKAAGPIAGHYTTADAVFSQLTGHRVSEACATAMNAGYLKLATLISQAGGDATFKADIRSQLRIWKDEKLFNPSSSGRLGAESNSLISRGVWKIYRLLSGPDDVDEASLESWIEEVCAGLDWKRVFGLCLWYGMGVDQSVADIVRLYEGLTRRHSSQPVARPLPQWYLDQQRGRSSSSSLALTRPGPSSVSMFSSTSVTSSSQQHTVEDPLYSLIRLHADPFLSLSQVLDPHSFGPDERWGGIGMCWHLYIILSRAMRVRDFADRVQPHAASRSARKSNGRINAFAGAGVDHEEDDGEEEEKKDGESHTANLLTSAYAFELESWGMVQEAAFVLLHLESADGRRKAIKDLIARSAPEMDDWMTRGLVGSLKIPSTWVNEAKAIYALNQGKVFDAYELYLSAQLWNAAHDLAVLELAPDAILRRDLDLLHDLFDPFDLEGRRDKVDGWFVRGKLFIDYANIVTRIPQLQEQILLQTQGHEPEPLTAGQPSPEEEIEDLARRVPKLIALLPDVLHRPRAMDDRHIAAIEEMTQALLSVLGKVKPAILLKQPLLPSMDASTKISLIRGKSYARFLQRVSA